MALLNATSTSHTSIPIPIPVLNQFNLHIHQPIQLHLRNEQPPHWGLDVGSIAML